MAQLKPESPDLFATRRFTAPMRFYGLATVSRNHADSQAEVPRDEYIFFEFSSPKCHGFARTALTEIVADLSASGDLGDTQSE